MLTLLLHCGTALLVIILTSLVVPAFNIDQGLQLIPAAIIVGFINFLMTPLLLGLRIRRTLPVLFLCAFIFDFLLINVAAGLIDEYDLESWMTSLLAAFILAFIQVIVDLQDRDRRNLIT